MSRPTDLVVDALAAYRLTRLVTRDKITAPLRAPLVDRPGLAGELVSCEWCVGVWASFGVVPDAVAHQMLIDCRMGTR